MLTELRFENFKSWRDTGVMRMAPLTGFFGTNSSGKTAILQFLLMLKQTVESNDQSQVLNLGNDNSYVDLGSTFNIAHRNRVPESLSWSIQFLPNIEVEVSVSPAKKVSSAKKSTIFFTHLGFSARVELDGGDFYLSKFTYWIDQSDDEGSPSGFSIERQQDGTYVFVEDEAPDEEMLFLSDEEMLVAPPVKHYQIDLGLNKTYSSDALALHAYTRVCSRIYEMSLERTYYLGPIRDYPKRFYSWSGEKPQDVGRRGENTIAALLTARKQYPEIEIKIAHWLKVMGLIDDFKVDLIAPEQRLYQASVRIAPGGTYCPITDVGFGVSQILPVLVLCYYVPKGSTIIFEQPEIHLHPSAQQKLADVFIDVIKHRELQIIIESHSEHLLHRLQRRIAEEELAPEQAALYFCQMENDGASSLTELELDPFGNIKNWPEDFFGDDMGDLVAMTDAAMKRQMVQEAS
jgi:predicted ATPase